MCSGNLFMFVPRSSGVVTTLIFFYSRDLTILIGEEMAKRYSMSSQLLLQIENGFKTDVHTLYCGICNELYITFGKFNFWLGPKRSFEKQKLDYRYANQVLEKTIPSILILLLLKLVFKYPAFSSFPVRHTAVFFRSSM
ncbi:hypothetical protein HHI36_002851 [Cryptolaemus montrouzieri]|uniref:Uncharacterized protein n=1 Tax=Cryptolaemus montrouzieri TaxID=559131 RepID=A0ABD2PBV4_9CUCU